MSRISTHFTLQEFCPHELFDRFGEKSIWFLDPKIIDIAEVVRSRFGKAVTINNWASGGYLNNRGFRMPDAAVGGKLSQHKFGRAIDFSIEGKTPIEIYEDIKSNFDIYSKVGLTTMEDIEFTKNWCHLDCRKTGLETLLIVKP